MCKLAVNLFGLYKSETKLEIMHIIWVLFAQNYGFEGVANLFFYCIIKTESKKYALISVITSQFF